MEVSNYVVSMTHQRLTEGVPIELSCLQVDLPRLVEPTSVACCLGLSFVNVEVSIWGRFGHSMLLRIAVFIL